MSRQSRTPNPLPISHGPRGPWVGTVIAACLVAGACKDSPTDLLPGLVAGETQPALALGVVLPDPTAWAADPGEPGDPDNSAQPLRIWRSSWDSPALRGRSEREASYDDLVALLPPERLPGVGTEALGTLRRALGRARSLPAMALPPAVRDGMARAATEADAAARAEAEGRAHDALVHVLRGSDALREVGPEAVARTLVDGVEDALRRIRPSATYSPEDTERLHRLAEGGRQALEEGDWVLAIRRAYYARALLTAH